MRKRPTAAIVTGVDAVAIIVGQLATTAAATNPRQASGSLTGTWSGTYNGAYRGTFILHWTESKSQLTGTIKLSSPKGSYGIDGSVTGSSIKFGAVTAGASYKGSVSKSGKSMGGTYTTADGGSGACVLVFSARSKT